MNGGRRLFPSAAALARRMGKSQPFRWLAQQRRVWLARHPIHSTKTGDAEMQNTSAKEKSKPQSSGTRHSCYLPGTKLVPMESIRPERNKRCPVPGLFPAGGLSVLTGAPSSGKSFFALRLGYSVAAGLDWFGYEVAPGGVVYVTCEGLHGVKYRLLALESTLRAPKDIPLSVHAEPVDLLTNCDNTDDFIKSEALFKREFNEPVTLIIVDPLAYIMPGGDPHSPRDVGVVLFHLLKIQRKTRAHVMFITDSVEDKDISQVNLCFYARADTVIRIGDGEAHFDKQRDNPCQESLKFHIRQVTVASNQHRECVTSAVIEPAKNSAHNTKPGLVKLTSQDKLAYKVIRKTIERQGVPAPKFLGLPVGTRVVTNDKLRRAFVHEKVIRGLAGKPTKNTLNVKYAQIKKKLKQAQLIHSPHGCRYVSLSGSDHDSK